MRFLVRISQWSSGDTVFGGGVHDVAKPSAELLAHLAGAEAAGDVEILEASDQHRVRLDRHIEPQEKSEAALAKAMGDWIPAEYDEERDDDGNVTARTLRTPGRWSGAWHDGNLENFDLDVAAGVRSSSL